MPKIDWPVKTLGEVAVLNPSEPALSEDAPFVPMDAVTAGKRQVQYIQPRGQRSGARARAGDILFARITPCLQNGKVALVQDEIERCGGSTEFIVVRAGTDVLNSFLYQWITAKHIRDHVTALMKGATGRQRLNAEDLALTELPVPPLEEQKRIVALLDAATARVTELTACYEQARTHANNLFTSALRDALESNPDWPVKTLGEVCELVRRGRPPSYCEVGGVIVLNQKCVRNGQIDFGPSRRTDHSSKLIPEWAYVREGDTLINSTGAGTLGRASFVSMLTEPTTFDTHLTVVRPRREICWPAFVGLVLNGREKDIVDLAGGATGQTELPREAVRSFEIPVPPFEEQKRIVLRLDSMWAKTSEMVAAYDAKLQAAKDLRQSVLEAAFAGEL
jgi:type I restriction enzyme S subunit